MKAKEIFLITFLFILCFMFSEVVLFPRLVYYCAVTRFILRNVLLVLYSILIYALFDSRCRKDSIEQQSATMSSPENTAEDEKRETTYDERQFP